MITGGRSPPSPPPPPVPTPMSHVTYTETENMVLIFLENIPENELPYLTGQGEHLLWEDEEG